MNRATRYRGTARAIAWRQLHNLFRNPALFLPPLLMPIFFFTAFAGGLSAIAGAPGFDYPDYNNFQFVFVLLQSAAFGGVFTGFAIAADFESGFGRRLMLASRDRTALIAGYAIVALARAAFTFAMLFVIALVVGMPVAADAVRAVRPHRPRLHLRDRGAPDGRRGRLPLPLAAGRPAHAGARRSSP